MMSAAETNKSYACQNYSTRQNKNECSRSIAVERNESLLVLLGEKHLDEHVVLAAPSCWASAHTG
jgi:hypothetical protein